MPGLAKIVSEPQKVPLDALVTLAPWAAEVRVAILADLGGEAELTSGALLLLDLAVRELVYVAAIDCWVATLPSIAGSGGRHRGILDQRTRLKASAEKTLDRLGALARRPPKAPYLSPLEWAKSPPEEPAE